MRSSKSRSRNKSNRQRSIGNIINRVFDSSGPEGKVRGTPQQIIEKYLALARDAQLGNDRVAEQNFLQHAEHYTRMLGEAQREVAREQEERQRSFQQNGNQNGNGGGQNNRDRQDRYERESEPRLDVIEPIPEAFAMIEEDDAGPVPTPEAQDFVAPEPGPVFEPPVGIVEVTAEQPELAPSEPAPVEASEPAAPSSEAGADEAAPRAARSTRPRRGPRKPRAPKGEEGTSDAAPAETPSEAQGE